jgi:hypothetical protein
MRIKRRLSAALFVLVTQACMAQNTTPDVITTAGGYQSNAFCSLSWTMGEPLIETGSTQQNYITQGFQQPASIIINSADNASNSQGNVTAYPNPVTSSVYINSTTNQSSRAEVMDLTGQTVYKKTVTRKDNEMNLSNLANGIYLLKVFTEEGKLLQTLKIDKIK